MNDLEPHLQRLIDGEMNARDREAFLQAADKEPSQWREIALAFVEHQRLQEDFSDLFSHDKAPSQVIPHPSSQRSSWWTLAASLVAMLALGFLIGQLDRTSTPLAIAQVEPPTPDPGQLRLRVQTQTADGQPQTLELPAYDEQSLFQHAPKIRQEGWQVTWQTDVLTGRLGDGRRVLVPVSSPSVHYRGQ